jgi:hypothetical protein
VTWTNRWPGATVVVLASGPSLTDEDIEVVRQWREAGDSRHVIVTNTTYQSALWADAVFFHDFKWWAKYRRDVLKRFQGERVTVCSVQSPHVCRLRPPMFSAFGNSGAGAISLAIYAGAAKVIALGIDCVKDGGKRHHFGDHPPGLGNAKSLPKWPNHFKRLAGYAQQKGVEVINASRKTALECFDRQPLEDALCLN